ncbi:MAG: histidine--tRNA ligase [bacterium]
MATQDSTKKGDKVENKKQFQSPRGMHDILPETWSYWERIEKAVHSITDCYNFSRIETPILEQKDLFERGVGEGTDIVEKEMFSLKTKGGDSLVLRPEATAAVMRSYFQHGMHRLPQPIKLFYFGPMFRHERPQAGRYRQFYQFGLEILGGDSDAIYDAQIILTTYRFLEELKLKDLIIHINSIGCKSCRQTYMQRLVTYYKRQKVCKDCERRMSVNPLRLLDCKNSQCGEAKKEAPNFVDSLCTLCKTHFKHVLEYLDELQLPYILDNQLVRGLDYYSRTVFEIFIEEGESAIAGGGRYDYLGKMIGGKPTPAVGSSVGVERALELAKGMGFKPTKPKQKVFLVHVGEMTKRKSLSLIEELRKNSVCVLEALGKDSLSAQMERASKEQASIALIFGQKEAFEGSIIVRDMETGVQELVPLSSLATEVKKRLKG